MSEEQEQRQGKAKAQSNILPFTGAVWKGRDKLIARAETFGTLIFHWREHFLEVRITNDSSYIYVAKPLPYGVSRAQHEKNLLLSCINKAEQDAFIELYSMREDIYEEDNPKGAA